MALADLQAFIVQCLQNVDSALDLTPGSPYDTQVVQPILQRLGTDPFTVDIGLFIQTTLNQQFPDLPTKEGDAITDLLIKTAIVLWNPIVREVSRIANAQSVRDPTLLTTDEADALGANFFATRPTGGLAGGVARIYFASPQSISITPANFFTSQEGLHFYPTQVQGIRVDEMLLNLEGTVYYFDVNVVAEQAGDAYNIGPDDLVTIANVASAQRVTNKTRFQKGINAETAVEFIDGIGTSLTERSLVTNAGITANLTTNFPEVAQLATVGFNDPQMKRDVITGGGLGSILASGFLALAVPDGNNLPYTTRVQMSDGGSPFNALLGPNNTAVSGYVLTLACSNPFFKAGSPSTQDVAVAKVVNANTLELAEPLLILTASTLYSATWTLRKQTLTLSNIPGGILYPSQPDGTVDIEPNQIHIGGCTDVFVVGTAFDEQTLVLSDITDDSPPLAGVLLHFRPGLGGYPPNQAVQLTDLVLGTNYAVGDSTYTLLANAVVEGLSLQVLDPPNAGTYRIVEVIQVPGDVPLLVVAPAYPNAVSSTDNFRWQVTSDIYIDLVEPKQTKISGSDLRTIQGSSTVDTASATDFQNYGVGVGDTLRISTGKLIIGDYTVIAAPLAPFYSQLQLDRPLVATAVDVVYSIFTPNPAGGIILPLIRISSIDLLDTSGQQVGTTIPYANPVDARSQGFANSAHGIKLDTDDGVLGLVTRSRTTFDNGGGGTLYLTWDGLVTPVHIVIAPNASYTMALYKSDINTQCSAQVQLEPAIHFDSNSRVGIIPVGPNTRILGSTSTPALMDALYGTGVVSPLDITSRDVRSAAVNAAGGWSSVRPSVDANFDVVQVLDGTQPGLYSMPSSPVDEDTYDPIPNFPYDGSTVDPLRTTMDFSPQVGVHFQLGARSLGKVRLYFQDPTSFECDENTVFTYTAADGTTLGYFPDPSNKYQRIPNLPSGAKPLDGVSVGTSVFSSASTDFTAQGIRPGDLLVLDYVPITGSVDLSDPVSLLNLTTLILNLGGGIDKTVTFIRDSGSILADQVTRAGVVSQINNTVGQNICSLTAVYQLQFNPTTSLIIRKSGTANMILGFSTTSDTNNQSVNAGEPFVITAVAPSGDVNEVVVSGTLLAETSEQFSVFRSGVQRIDSTTMASNVETASLYYFDVELLSEGSGDQYNIPSLAALTVTGFRSDGYYLTTKDPNLTFSPVEQPILHITPTILSVGVGDNPQNATDLTGQNIQLNYDQSSLAANVDSYIRSDTERVLNESPLGRHLIPYFVRFSMNYTGGSGVSVVTSDVETYIASLAPAEALTVSDLEQIAEKRGATEVDNPITLIALIHNFDRSITAERSQNSLNTGTLAAFISDVLDITQSTS